MRANHASVADSRSAGSQPPGGDSNDEKKRSEKLNALRCGCTGYCCWVSGAVVI